MMARGLFQPLVLASVLASGFLVVWSVVALWAVRVGADSVRRIQREKTLLFLQDGTPRIAHIDYQHGEREYWDLEGHSVPPPDNGSAGSIFARSLPAALPDRVGSCATTWDQRIRSFTDGGSPAVYWYFVCDQESHGAAYFVGYDSKSRTRAGFLGTCGFRTNELSPEELIPFGHDVRGPGEGVLCTQDCGRCGATSYAPEVFAGAQAPRGSVSPWDVYVVGRDAKIYHANLQKRTVEVALQDSLLCSAGLVPGVWDAVRGTPYRPAARTKDAVLILDEHGQRLKRYPIPEPLRSQDFRFAETTAGEALMYWEGPLDALATKIDYRIYWVTPDGCFRKAEVTLPTDGELRQMRVLGAVVVPSPLALGTILATMGPATLLDADGHAATYTVALRRILAEFWPALMVAQLLAAGLAFLCYRRAVRYRATRSERALWPLFVFALGLPGWVAYRFGLPWPVLESCPACGTDVPQDRGDCARCEATFPRPALKGTEVFA